MLSMRLLFALYFSCCFMLTESHAQNLVKNPGFEAGAKSWVIRTASIDPTTKYSGKHSLYYRNTDASRYQVLLTHVQVKGGEVLDFSVMLKGKNVRAQSDYVSKGAGIYLHAYDKNDKSLGGNNPPTFAGTFDWTLADGRFKVPQGATKVAVSLYMVKGTTGEVWFDDVVVRRANTKSLQAYRASNSVSKSTKVYIDDEGFTVKNGKRIFPYGVYIGKGDDQGIMKDFSRHLQQIKDGGFNTVLSYYYGNRSNANAQSYLKLADQIGLNVIYSFSDFYDGSPNYADYNVRANDRLGQLVEALKNEPALLSWYIADELPLSYIVAAERNYQKIKSIDVDHPVYQVTDKPAWLPDLQHVSDVIGTDPYPVNTSTNANLKMVTDWTKPTIGFPNKGVWQVVQAFNKGLFNSQNRESYVHPTEQQVKNMVFQSIIGGAKGILLYGYHHLAYRYDVKKGAFVVSQQDFEQNWAQLLNINKEMATIIPVVLENQIVTINVQENPNVQHRAWRYQNDIYLMLANTSKQEQIVTVEGIKYTLDKEEARFVKL